MVAKSSGGTGTNQEGGFILTLEKATNNDLVLF